MIDVVLCASGSDEVRIVHALASDHADEIRVVRRCADLAETLAVVAAGIGDAVLIDLTVRGLDRDALTQMLTSAGAVVGMTHEETGSSRPTTLGLRHVVDASAPVTEIVGQLLSAVDPEDEQSLPAPAPEDAAESLATTAGQMVAVWGPIGAPGRSWLAANIAHEAARAGTPTVLVDADTYGPCLAQMLGILDDAPGLVAACRASARDTLDEETLTALVPQIAPNLRFLSGIGVAARWPEVRATAVEGVWDALAELGALVVVDVGFCLEEDEELAYDTMAPRRNAAATTALARADTVLAVVASDPVSVTRLLRERDRLSELGVDILHAVINRTGPPAPADRMAELLTSRLDVAALSTVPEDTAACRRAAWDGAMLAEVAPKSAARRAVRDLAARLAAPVDEALAAAAAEDMGAEEDEDTGRDDAGGQSAAAVAARAS